jgi:hypothetical protein
MEGDLTRLTELGFWLEKFVTAEFYIGIVLRITCTTWVMMRDIH